MEEALVLRVNLQEANKDGPINEYIHKIEVSESKQTVEQRRAFMTKVIGGLSEAKISSDVCLTEMISEAKAAN